MPPPRREATAAGCLLADLAVESDAATVLMLRPAGAYDMATIVARATPKLG